MGAKTGQPVTSGNWHVRSGREGDFVEAWTEFIRWTHAEAPGAGDFTLLQDEADLQHFVSYGYWSDEGHIEAWRNSAGFAERFARCRELCEDFAGSDYTAVAAVNG